MSLLTSVIDQFTLSCTKDNEIGEHDDDLYHLVFDYYLSSDAIEHFSRAIYQLDTTLLDDSYQWLLFTGFNAAMDIGYYDDKHRDQLCQSWLPKYQSTLNELISLKESQSLPLNAIKYVLSNLIRMQITIERVTDHFMKQELEFHRLNAKDDYLALIRTVLPLLTNEQILQSLDSDDYFGVEFRWDANTYSNTSEMTATFVVWILLKVLLMFIKTDGDCFATVKYDPSIKEILSQSIKLIHDQHPVKLSLYVIFALLVNERDLDDDTTHSKETFAALIGQIKQVGCLNGETDSLTTNGVYNVDLLLALKAYLYYDLAKHAFIENDGLDSLVQLANPLLAPTEISSSRTELFRELSRSLSEMTQEDGTDPSRSQAASEIKTSVENGLNSLLEEMALVALECLHVLSFDLEAKKTLRQSGELMSHLRQIAKDHPLTATNRRLNRTINGLLWKLEREDEYPAELEKEHHEKNEPFDFMISYDEEDKPLVTNIHQYLTDQLGYTVYFDEQPLPDPACRAIEQSRHVLVCLSETYRSSPHCRTEAEYARERSKPIIPLIIKQVERDGWLEGICAGQLCIDFMEEEFQKAVQMLQNEVERNDSEDSPDVNSLPQEIVPQVPSEPSSPVHLLVEVDDYKTMAIETWTDQHVQRFLRDHRLDTMLPLTENMNGEELQLLFERCQTDHNYWAMFDRLNSELNLRFQQILPMSVYIRFLHQLQKYVHVAAF